jgi:hypothetical protein
MLQRRATLGLPCYLIESCKKAKIKEFFLPPKVVKQESPLFTEIKRDRSCRLVPSHLLQLQ